MSKDSRIDSTSLQGTVSKYFCRNSDADESSDFEEPKYKFKRPVVQKPKAKSKPKQRKRGKGQKDIRSALKGGKSDLISYTEDLKKVCCQSGIDVDSEQLQIAIAISKSLQDIKESSDEVSQSTSSVERCNRIKKTLLEYGFKVPDNKKSTVTKKTRGIKKHSKLLHTSEEVRQQLIIDKYSQLLFSFNISASDTTSNTEITDIHSNYLYSLSTQQPYSYLRNNTIFYVKDLFQESTAKLGNLLKDWSKIPGRTSSPITKKLAIKPFSTMSIEQEQLDGILSGKMAFSNAIINNVELSYQESSSKAELNPKISSGQKLEDNKIHNNYQITLRSQSPDLFDDATILDSSNEEEKTHTAEDMQTVCHNTFSNHELQNTINVDYEDIDKAVSIIETNTSPCFRSKVIDNVSLHHESIQRIQDNIDEELINDLTQSSDSDDCSLPYVAVGKYDIDSSVNVDCIKGDNSSSSNSNFNEYIYHHSDHSSVGNNSACISNNVGLANMDNKGKKCKLVIDLTQSPPDEDKLCTENFTDEDRLNGVNANNILNAEHINYYDVDNDIKANSLDKYVLQNVEDLSNSPHKPTSFHSTQDELVSPKSSNIENSIGNSINLDLLDMDQKAENFHFEIDLTQSSPDEDKVCINNFTMKDGINEDIAYNGICAESIVYDVYCDNGVQLDKNVTQDLSSAPHKSTSFHNTLEDTVSSQSSNIAFEISDEELDYSMNKSKYCKENSFDCDKLSDNITQNIYNSLPDEHFTRTSIFKPSSTFSRSFSDSSLPAVHIKGTKSKAKTPVKSSRSQTTTPVKKVIDEDISIKTPKNNGYTIKTQNVTPMLNYDTLATPQINKELDKYGLKPFKRKRAIQLLKHLYNQTHPIIEKTDDDLPTKRFKPSTSRDVDLETGVCDDIYVCTNEVPILEEVACDPDQWVFQKKEKSKISSCRVPLHISFHNYVSCRRYLRDAILRYEPVSIDIIHKQLVEYGFRYDPKDLLKFMDKKCITVKTADINKKRTKN